MLLYSSFCRLPSISQPNSALGAPRGGPSSLFTFNLPREWQRSCYQLQGVSEPDLCGRQDPPARGEVWGLQWSYGRFLEESVGTTSPCHQILYQNPLSKSSCAEHSTKRGCTGHVYCKSQPVPPNPTKYELLTTPKLMSCTKPHPQWNTSSLITF